MAKSVSNGLAEFKKNVEEFSENEPKKRRFYDRPECGRPKIF